MTKTLAYLMRVRRLGEWREFATLPGWNPAPDEEVLEQIPLVRAGNETLGPQNTARSARWICAAHGEQLTPECPYCLQSKAPQARALDEMVKVSEEIGGYDLSAEKTAALQIRCDHCTEYLTEPGALMFSPPVAGQCRKLHLCVSCFEALSKKTSAAPTEVLQLLGKYSERAKLCDDGHQPLIHFDECPVCLEKRLDALS